VAVDSRAKGKRAELLACQTLRDLFGWTVRRSQQFSGWARGGASPDLICDQTPSLFWEIKWVEKLSLPKAMGLAVKQAGRKTPVVMHRTSRSANGWLLTIRLTDLPLLCHAYESASNDSMAAPSVPRQDADSNSCGEATARTTRPVSDR
jgi:hypothetical protein